VEVLEEVEMALVGLVLLLDLVLQTQDQVAEVEKVLLDHQVREAQAQLF
jgi:hypothetical protein